MRDDEKFIRLEAESFAVRVERHTEFMSLSLIDIDHVPKTGLRQGVYDEATYPHLPFAEIKQLGHPIFHAMWLEITQTSQNAANISHDGGGVAGTICGRCQYFI